MYNLKVVIIGAGIGGLTAGIALRQAGYEVEIYDRVKELRPAGAGISLWSNGVKVLNRLGLGEKMAAIGGLMDRMQYLTLKGDVLSDIDLHPLVEEVGQRPYPVARTDLQQMLLEAYPGEVKLEHKCIAVEQDENSVTAIFENGHRTTGDLLIAADGVRSLLRTYVLGQEVQPNYGHYVNWNGLVPASEDLAAKNSWVIFVGEHKRASMMPVAGDRFYFFFDVPLPKGTVSSPENYRAELTEHFQGWAQPVQNLIQRLDPYKTNRLEIHDVGPIDRMVRGRVALLGDAAHATCPDLGQGGCQAMEDGLVLTQYLLTTNISMEYALKRYEADRKERTSAVVEKARKRAEMIHGKEPEITQKWYQQLAQEEPADVRGAIAKVILAGPLR
ncbi:MAG: FAD-dependent urate hydroxylase [Chroococcidiopsis cubana SAG 39.79]|jgi:FAD-dependent urate hydroxylase|uniref:FAD-dependent urate hydroxylase n=1 Tax=Chroococcidiopsis cubana SAG 39.79 TaxID=388085 RepID=A0AB37UQ94_9CYAN|nr:MULTISPECIES: FAD-dependent urate hydroxylase HpxO [Chroococcidiopsis]MBE9016145.1 FAD-dependent urate hydroxylase HpxO [Chroococcidiopsidales cyanobacterium LEGE 13417]PSB47183.1 monooxygenase [Cyanosarcina cf. burmensis CCALA 770]MDZ4873726.1 FAD-dependent urate hydroxylase [Chroococcidiopsis cubana SAG 39.79]PSB63999.1 monooxygenase [Chroococcidiopsis cubana CCALA 043]RUT13594.1 monooxygenase [Chroococcidiopsis cubana SAG 39.79]